MSATTIYCIDTSSVFEWYIRRYPPALLPKLPERIEGLIAAGRLRAPKAVLDEIKPGDDCHTWAKGQTDLFVEESTDIQKHVKRLMAAHHNPSKPLKGFHGADPFVIGMAIVGGPQWVVVTDEHLGTAESPKIPYVCGLERKKSMTFQGMMLAEGWTFT